jgi:polysaccharide export outer membrane protein
MREAIFVSWLPTRTKGCRCCPGRLAFVITMSIAFGGCSSALNGEFVELDAGAPVTQARRSDDAVVLPSRSVEASGSYKIGYADVLDISVFKVPELARTVEVDMSGTINLPLLGDVSVAGKSVRDVERELAKKLEGKYLQAPQVTVSIKEFNSQRVTVEGAVKKPGVHALKGRTTLLQIIAMSGGVETDISDSTVVVFRNVDAQRHTTKFDLDSIRSGQAPDPLILPGDVVIAGTSAIKTAWSEIMKGLPAASTARAATPH